MRDLEEELSDIAGPPFPVAVAGVEQFSSGKQPTALVARSPRAIGSTGCTRRCRRWRATAASRSNAASSARTSRSPRFPQGAETGHHLAQFMASHSTFQAGPWIADHFALYSSRSGRGGRSTPRKRVRAVF